MYMYKPARFKWLRNLVKKIWVKYPTKRNHWLYKFCFPCEHTHTFEFYLPEDTTWFFKGERRGEHSQLLFEGCYLCGKVRVRDWGA